MKCDKCDKEATVHEVTIKGGQRHEKHLCEACAAGDGVAAGGGTHTPITDLLSSYITAQSQAAATVASGAVVAPGGAGGAGSGTAGACAGCGMTYAQFRHSGLMGCPACYGAFEAQLTPLLARAHEGGTHHVGKTPRRGGGGAGGTGSVGSAGGRAGVSGAGAGAAVDAERVARLTRELAQAVAGEEYEKAARLRDELRRLEGRRGGVGGGDAGGKGEA